MSVDGGDSAEGVKTEQMDMEMTLQAKANEEITLPMACMENTMQYEKPRLKRGVQVGLFTLMAPLTVTGVSELWYAKDPGGSSCVVKLTNHKPDRELVTRIQALSSPYLVEILDMGEYRNMWYEVTPWYRRGNLEGPVPEEAIKSKVVPSVTQALQTLHAEGIAHNDIKPRNLFWDDKEQKVLLGDFGCVSALGSVPPGFTPSYAAPEILMRGPGKRSTDWCSVGLTLAALAEGKGLFSSGDAREIIYRWETGLRYEGGSREFQRLVNGMLQVDPKRRLGPKAAASWVRGGRFGGEARKTAFQGKKEQFLTIKFDNPPMVAATIPMLLEGIASHWDYAAFLFRQKKFDRFLDQFDHKWPEICQEIRNTVNDENALFLLTLELMEGTGFLWRGVVYHDLSQLEEEWRRSARGEENVLAFLQRGMADAYLKRTGAHREQIEFVKRLQVSSHYHPEESCFQLFQALKGEDGFEWKGARFTSLSDLVRWLDVHVMTLDQEIEELMESKYFEAWFEYMGMGGVLDQIRRRCRG